jgi:hypothetical protein
MVGVSHSTIGRIERGEARHLTMVRVVTIAIVLGLDVRILFYPLGTPARDAAHLALIECLRVRVSPAFRWRTEVPVPLPGDLRSADVVIDGLGVDIMVEAETRLGDVQALERHLGAKQRDVGVRRLILLVGATRHNREVIATVPELRRRFPVPARACLRALALGRDPGGDAILML